MHQIINQQANFVRNLSRISSDAFDPEAIEKASLNLKTDLFMANKRITDVKNEIAEADAVAERVASFLTIKERFIDVLNGNDNIRWRELLIALDTRIQIIALFTMGPFAWVIILYEGMYDNFPCSLTYPSIACFAYGR